MTQSPLKMKYVFGPVPSKRLGQSLGIDTIPLKTCNWNCVYCQLGRTTPLTNERKEYFPCEDILAEVREALKQHPPGKIDWITFVGSGEPTLHSGMGALLQGVKAMTEIPVAVITNGSLLYLPEVRSDLLLADAVMPTVSAGSEALYRQIHRPHPDVTFSRLVEGIKLFRQEYTGQLWIEVMLIQDLNDTTEALQELAVVLRDMQPDEIHLMLPTRPPTETWVKPADEEGLLRARAILGEIAKVFHPAEGSFDLEGYKDVREAILGVIQRHPMSQEELQRTLERWVPNDVQEALQQLKDSGEAQEIIRHGKCFWSASASHYPDEEHSEKTSPKRLCR